MTTGAGKPTYLGGIGTMLSQVEICPNCGQNHSEVVYAPRGRQVERGCSRSVVGALPYLSRIWESSAYASMDEVILTADEGEFLIPPARHYSPRDPPLAVHLPPPPEAEEALP